MSFFFIVQNTEKFEALLLTTNLCFFLNHQILLFFLNPTILFFLHKFCVPKHAWLTKSQFFCKCENAVPCLSPAHFDPSAQLLIRVRNPAITLYLHVSLVFCSPFKNRRIAWSNPQIWVCISNQRIHISHKSSKVVVLSQHDDVCTSSNCAQIQLCLEQYECSAAGGNHA